MLERLSLFIEYIGVNMREFERVIGAADSTIRKAILKNTGINSKWIESITEKYPQLNLIWLLTGEGEMLRNQDQIENIDTKNNTSQEKNLREIIAVQKDLIDEQKGIIKDLRDTITDCREQIKTYKLLIEDIDKMGLGQLVRTVGTTQDSTTPPQQTKK